MCLHLHSYRNWTGDLCDDLDYNWSDFSQLIDAPDSIHQYLVYPCRYLYNCDAVSLLGKYRELIQESNKR